MNRRQGIAALAVVLLSPCSLAAQVAPAASAEVSPRPKPTDTIKEFRLATRKNEKERAEREVAPLLQQAAQQLTQQTNAKIAAQTNAVAPAADFGSRVNESLTDFLPLFKFAVNSISTAEDRKSVTASFNPLRVGRYGAINLKATATEPEISQQLLGKIVESSREAQKEALGKQVDDFSDITWALTYGFQRSDEFQDWDTARHRFGRNAKLYENLVDVLVADRQRLAFEKSEGDNTQIPNRVDDLGEILHKGLQGTKLETKAVMDLTFKEIEDALEQRTIQGFDLKSYTEAILAEGEAYAAMIVELAARPSLDGIAPLIANQPQLTLSAVFRQRDDFVGRDTQSYVLSYELGRRNFNRVLKTYRFLNRKEAGADEERRSQLRVEAYEEVVEDPRLHNQDKFTFSASYLRRDAQKLDYAYQQVVTDPATGDDSMIDRTASLDLKRGEEFTAMVLWTRFARAKRPLAMGAAEGNALDDPKPQISLSVEFIDVQDDPMRQNRLVGKLSYTMPVAEGFGIGIPITLTYANKSEFLGEQDQVLSAHVGLSFDLDRKEK